VRFGSLLVETLRVAESFRLVITSLAETCRDLYFIFDFALVQTFRLNCDCLHVNEIPNMNACFVLIDTL